ncbi:UDP-glycosyltransferase UGT5-like isoform X1 [Anthonomus grandis grandis]|uniref:UDP-glycosyltransferase UGT5-like isoform X1 n=1 Tax=Anthonomus grandis grandis TaxID=2921223 RepID=UPI002165F53A|nr:UDP-glycosyltransferase UGT5-like isoform X1 [Anthonomus grandis grandis]
MGIVNLLFEQFSLKMNVTQIFLICCVTFQCVFGGRLLGIFPIPGGSHYILASRLMKELAKDGHHVTMITPYPTKGLEKEFSWDDIVIEGLADHYFAMFSKINIFEDSNRSAFQRVASYQDLMMHWLNETLYHPKVRALMTPDTKFDAVVMEDFFNDAHKYFAYHFQCPLILMSSMGPIPWVNNKVANPSPPSYIPHAFYAGDFDPKNFWDRFFNFWDYVIDLAIDNFYFKPLHNDVLQKAFPGAPRVQDLNENVSLILLNSHESLLQSVPLVPSMVQIGGYHVDAPSPLPKDLKEVLDNAKDGVVYFCMGSNIKAKEMDVKKKQAFVNALGRLKQKVLWKFEDTNITLPKNIIVRSWMPQKDILAHPNVKLFITHSGFLSTIETIYHGVPVLAIPVFADQFMNAKKAVAYGYGLKLAYNDPNFSEEALSALLDELLTNPKYHETAKFRSKLYHDRLATPIETLNYWVNYTLRYKGAKHLQVAGVQLPLHQYLLLDVVGFMVAGLVFSLWIVLVLFKRVRMIVKTGSKQKTQ